MRLFLSVFALLALLLTAAGQDVPMPPADGPAGAKRASPAPDAAKQPPQESPRLQKLKQLQFDRRPSTILKAWSKPPGKDDEEEPKAPPGQPKPKKDPIDEELAAFRRHVTLGDWAAVKKYLAGLPEDEAKAGYAHLLQSLQNPPAGAMQPQMMMPGMPPMPQQFWEQHSFSADDVLGIATAAPKGLDKDLLTSLGAILRRAIAGGTAVEHVVARFKAETAKPAKEAVLTVRQAARLLAGADEPVSAAAFLPSLDKAAADKDHEALNLLARHYVALHAKDKKNADLEKAWEATQAALAGADGPRAEREEALKRAVELAPQIKETLGQKWLEESFTKQPERGMDILATVGGLVSKGLQFQPMQTDLRHKELQLQKTAVEALLKAAPERAKEWRATLSVLAGAWLREAEFSQQFGRSAGMGPRMHRDRWGNIFYINDDDPMQQMFMMRQQNMPQAVAPGDVLDTRPSEAWLAGIDAGLRPRLTGLYAHLFLKVNEEEKAYPHIEELAKTHPDKARELVKEFLRVWTSNHDPNAARGYTNPYMFMFGFERRSDSIPLTRSKQERNLVELAGWVGKLRKLPIGDPDEELLAKAFTACHSNAEVYRLEAIEKVFGPIGTLKPKTLAELAQQMRENLAGVWRQPAVQKDKKTNRKQKDIEAEVLRGYALAGRVIEDALKKFPDDWSLHLARAALLHDETNYRQEVAKSSDFSAKREQALAGFRKAAQLYATKVKELKEDEQSNKVYEQWFYASLGAVDLQHVNSEKLPDLRQPPLIRDAIKALPGEAATRHLDKFANQLFTRMSAVAPEAKYRYLRSGFEIVGDHKQAWEARKVYDYYKDLVQELKLETVIDGGDKVGHKQPFGVFVHLRHTREIERESGGFGRYLQNQNTSTQFYWNYGRPTNDYRDKFQQVVLEALKEHFEVLSVTFETENVHSRAAAEYGWRITPYAYLLLRARGPQVDKVPPLRIDLDFLDTSGYVILPIESASIPLDAAPAEGTPRPLRKLQLTQILDERQAEQGKLIVEIKATAQGLIGGLDQVLDLNPDGFEVVKTEDRGLSVGKFAEDSDQIAVVSERNWLVTLRARDDQGAKPASFRFGKAKVDGTDMIYQRYQDADLAAAKEEVSLEHAYGKGGVRLWAWVAGAAVGVVVLALLAAVVLWLRSRPKAARGVDLPEHLTPFTVTTLLQRIEREGRMSEVHRAELRGAIADLEQRYFAAEGDGNGEVDLRRLAETWAVRAG